MRRGAVIIAAFLVCASVLSALPSPRAVSADRTARDALLPIETACLGMSAPPEPKPGRTALAPAPGRALPASSWPRALAAQLLLALPVLALRMGRAGRARRRHLPRPLMAHRIHAPPA